MKTQSNCYNLQIFKGDLTADGLVVDFDMLDGRCSENCLKRHTCEDILNLLDQGYEKQAQALLNDEV